ncbi:MAG TPA: L-seryl-tRNA(Sec) selenium transferase [Bacillales bacterium]
MKSYLRHIPAVHVLQQHSVFKRISADGGIPEPVLTGWLQEETDKLRTILLDEKWEGAKPTEEGLANYLLDMLDKRVQLFSRSRLRRVINGTGVVLHTNLGRARLGENAVKAVRDAALNYSNLEYDLAQGKRGSRHDLVESLICEVTGAEAAMVVNNNAAAVYLVLRALAQDREVIVSRGQLVEIGGSFRVSAIMEESGARLVEVGTTNKTHFYDYEQAVGEETAMLMKVHTSNFKISGFTESVETDELSGLAQQHGLVFYEDLGSGAFHDFASHGVGEEPLVSEVLREGTDLVTCSGDKLLGGPQAGIIAGKKQWINQLKKHQLARVLRVDKMTFAALEATLKDYVRRQAAENVPTVRDILTDAQEIKTRSQRFIDFAAEAVPGFCFELAEDESQIGGGTMPDVFLPTYGVLVKHNQFSVQGLANSLRACDPPVITRMKDEQVYIDFRTVADDEIETMLGVFRQLAP